jgi:hypothetical protein
MGTPARNPRGTCLIQLRILVKVSKLSAKGAHKSAKPSLDSAWTSDRPILCWLHAVKARTSTRVGPRRATCTASTRVSHGAYIAIGPDLTVSKSTGAENSPPDPTTARSARKRCGANSGSLVSCHPRYAASQQRLRHRSKANPRCFGPQTKGTVTDSGPIVQALDRIQKQEVSDEAFTRVTKTPPTRLPPPRGLNCCFAIVRPCGCCRFSLFAR